MQPTDPGARGTSRGPTLPIRVIVAGDIRLYRTGIVRLLRHEEGLEVVGEASDAGGVMEFSRGGGADLLLLDMAMPGSLDVVRDARAAHLAVVALALPEVEATFLTCVEAGICSYVARDASAEDLVEAIRAAARGEAVVSPGLTGSLLRRLSRLSSELGDAGRAFDLTPREAEVADLIAQGKSNKGIAAALDIGLATVKNHVHQVLKKMNASRRSEVAARIARRAVSEPPSLRARRRLDHVRPKVDEHPGAD